MCFGGQLSFPEAKQLHHSIVSNRGSPRSSRQWFILWRAQFSEVADLFLAETKDPQHTQRKNASVDLHAL